MTTAATTTNQSPGVKKKQKGNSALKKLSTKQKAGWVDHPTYEVLVKTIKDTFTSKTKKISQLPINKFINHYNKNLDKGWLNLIKGNLSPLVTVLCYGANIDENEKVCISFFISKLDALTIQSDYQQTKEDLITIMRDLHQELTQKHPIEVFLSSNHGVKQ